MRVGTVVLVEAGMGTVTVGLGGVALLVGVDCTREAQDANRHITRFKIDCFILFCLFVYKAIYSGMLRIAEIAGKPGSVS